MVTSQWAFGVVSCTETIHEHVVSSAGVQSLVRVVGVGFEDGGPFDRYR